MNIYRPLQISLNHRVLEQNRKFYFTASAALGVNLQSGETLLEFDQLKDAFACMGEPPLPDMGMPKPKAEFLVSGSFYTPGAQEVVSGQVRIKLGQQQKDLYISGFRQWRHGLPSTPDPFKSMPIDYAHAFGGDGFEKNPHGMGYKDDLLPCIEYPNQPVTSPNDRPDPAGFSVLDPIWPQRMRFQGTYNKKYLKKYFPGYPEDFDWRHFLCAPEDQWINGFFQGNELFEIHNMHPDIPVIKGALPGLYVRCFLMRTLNGAESEFAELPMNLDTIWLFPEKMLAILIWRGVTEVTGDEADEIAHILLAYEDGIHKSPHGLEYYRDALEKRISSDDAFLTNLNTQDLIPEDHKCAMELLMEMGLSEAEGEESEFLKNIDAKAEAIQKMTDKKIGEAIQQAEKKIENIDVPSEVWEHIPGEAKTNMPGKKGGFDLKKLMNVKSDTTPDPDVEALNRKLEAIMPGITAGDPKKLEMKNFSFNKFNKILETIEAFTDKKEKKAMGLAKKEILKAKDQVKGQIDDICMKINEAKKIAESTGVESIKSLEEARQKLETSYRVMDDINLEKTQKAPLPRIDSKEIKAQISQVDPQMMDAMQHLQSMKDMGIEDERTHDLEKQIRETMETYKKQVEEGLQEAQKGFKKGYFMGAHFMEDGLSPHKEPVETVAERLLRAIALGDEVSNGDWACIDLSRQNLDGVDLNGAFLEQVNFKGASLKAANLSGSIMARANLEDADLSGANLAEANLGGVHAHRADFTGANLRSAKLSKGDFTDAEFTRADLEDVESLEVVVNGAKFTEAHMPSMKFIGSELRGTAFSRADLSTTVFYDCNISDVDCSEALMARCAFADSRLEDVSFDGADLTSACFVATDLEKSRMQSLRFRGACLYQSNFKDMVVQGADYNGARLENSIFNGADLSGADFSNAYAKSAQFRKALLTGSTLDNINLMEGSLSKASIVNASFVGANLYAVDFLRSVIEDTDFSDSNRAATLLEE